jgi:SRF-type transcription factor (DNA-binding and dimerisation domain)
MMELEAERISPTFTSRYMTNYTTASPTDIYHQNYHSPRQNMQSFYPVLENDRSYLKRHYYVKDEMEGDEREKKYEKLIDHHGYPHAYHTNELYDTYNNNTLYPEPPLERSATADSNSIILANSTNSNDNYPINSSPATSIEDASEKIADSPKSVVSGKKTKGRVKIKMEYIENKLRRYTTFSKRKTGIMKKVSKKVFRKYSRDSNSE